MGLWASILAFVSGSILLRLRLYTRLGCRSLMFPGVKLKQEGTGRNCKEQERTERDGREREKTQPANAPNPKTKKQSKTKRTIFQVQEQAKYAPEMKFRNCNLKSIAYSVAGFNYALFGLCKRYSHVAFTVISKAQTRCHSYPSIKQPSGKLH